MSAWAAHSIVAATFQGHDGCGLRAHRQRVICRRRGGNPNIAAYSAAKAGVLGLTKSLGKELAKFDIAVNAITPGMARTPMLDGLAPEFIEYMKVRILRDRFVELDEISSMVVWLLSAENSFTIASIFDPRYGLGVPPHHLPDG